MSCCSWRVLRRIPGGYHSHSRSVETKRYTLHPIPDTLNQVAIKVMTEALAPEKCAGFSVVVMVDAPLDDCIAYPPSPTA